MKNENNYIITYYKKINSGEIVAPKWVKLAYKWVITNIETGEFVYDHKKAIRAIKFCENFLHHYKERTDLIKLELWQKSFISCVFGVLDKEGNRQFHEVLLIVGRKNGKSVISSVCAACVAFLESESGKELFFIAPQLKQADICFKNIVQMIKREPELEEMCKIRKTDIYLPDTESEISRLSFDNKKSDGLSISFCSCDEVGAWPAVSGNAQYQVLASSLGARKNPLILSITTANSVNNGPYDDLYMRGTKLLLGNSNEKRFLPLIYQIEDESKWDDLEELKKANPNMGVSVSEDWFLEEIEKAKISPQKKSEFLMKYCNIKQASYQAVFSSQMINNAYQKTYQLSDFAHSYCVAGFDLSQTTDLTSTSVIIEKDNILNVFSHFWLPQNKLEEAIKRDSVPYDLYLQQGYLSLSGEGMINYKDILNYFLTLIRDYEILPLVIGYDRYSASFLVQEMRETYSLNLDDVFQGYNLSPVLREAEGLLLSHRINIADGNPLMKIHMANSAVETDRIEKRVRLVKIQKQNNIHIDGVAAMLDALTVRQKWYEQYKTQLSNG